MIRWRMKLCRCDCNCVYNFAPSHICSYTDTDLVVVVTMRPSSTASVAGYAIAYQRDTERRATLGLFNWCPHTVDETLYKIETEEEKLSVRHWT